MVFSLEHDIKVTKNHQNLLPTQSVPVAHTVWIEHTVILCPFSLAISSIQFVTGKL
jgi:hypothetical protein